MKIIAYGTPILKQKAKAITKDYPDLKKLISDMKDTMYKASGVGIAAPQVNLSIRLFVVDSTLIIDEDDDEVGIKETFINATMLEEEGKEWTFEEGCLSIPGIRTDIDRKPNIKIHYFDEKWKEHTKVFSGTTARVIQHEYDHIEGILFTDHLKPLKKRMLKKRLNNITLGKVDIDYKMKFPK